MKLKRELERDLLEKEDEVRQLQARMVVLREENDDLVQQLIEGEAQYGR